MKLKTWRTQFPIESPFGITALFAVDNERIKSIELLPSGAVLVEGREKSFVIHGNSLGFLADGELERAKGATDARPSKK